MFKKILLSAIIFFIFNLILSGQNINESDSLYADIDEEEYLIMLDFKVRSKENATEVMKTTKKQIYCYISSDSTRSFCYIRLTKKELKEYFNLEILHRVIKGAGNSLDTDAHYDDISNIEELSPNMRKILKGVDIIDDPKFEIYAEEKAEDFDIFFSE